MSLTTHLDQPLIVGDTVLVSFADSSITQLIAYNAENGHIRWLEQTSPYHFMAPIAASSDVVFVATPSATDTDDTTITAFSIANGSRVWSREITNAITPGVPAVDNGTIYLVIGEEVFALSAADGSIEWSASVGFTAGPSAEVAVDDQRVYVADGCGGAIAFDRSPGLLPVWDNLTCSESGRARVYNGRVYAEDGQVYHAASGGAQTPLQPGQPDAFEGGLGYYENDNSAGAVDLNTGQTAWAGRVDFPYPVGTVSLGHTVYFPGYRTLDGYAASDGTLLSRTRLPDGSPNSWPWQGIAAGAGKLVVSSHGRVTALEPVFTPAPNGISIAASAFDLIAGKRIAVGGGVGSELRPRRPPIVLVGNPAVGRTERVRFDQSLEDGTAYFRGKLTSNTRYTVLVPNDESRRAKPLAKDSFTAYGYAKIALTQARYVSLHRILVAGKVTKVRAKALAGARMVTYYGPRKARRLKRIGTSKWRPSGKHEVRSRFRFRVPGDFGRHDLLTICVKDLPQLGYGRNTGVLRHCGERKLRVDRRGKAAPATAPASSAAPAAQ